MAQGLGRGLSSLIPQKINNTYSDFDVSADNKLEISDKNRILYIDPAKIVASPMQPRQKFSEEAIADLAASIKEHGIIQPLVVVRIDDGFELIAGERRLRASKSIGLKEVPVIVREASTQKKLELALIENVQREALNPIETAIAYNQLMNEFNLSQDEAAHRVGKPRSSVANTLRLITLPAEIQLAIIEKKISESHAKYLLGIEGEVQQLSMFRKIMVNNLSVRDTDKLIKSVGGTKAAKVVPNFNDRDKEDRLARFFNSKVELRRKSHGGQIVINFSNDEELGEILNRAE
ncbi:MAG: ParB/RepB/Spo0J family partition protein [Candidatus Falkowbacteria bacterium]